MYYPICVDLKGKLCLVVGGGEVAERKVASLLQAGGGVRVVSPAATAAIAKWGRAGKLRLEKRKFRPADLDGSFLVVGATDDPRLHRKIFELCRRKNILVNIVDKPALCSFTVPAVVRRGRLLVAISTDGASPGLAKKIRSKLEKVFGAEYAVFLDWMERARAGVVKRLPSQRERKAIFKKLVGSRVLSLLSTGKKQQARSLFRQIVGKPKRK